jgi:hypothetical protein
MKVIKKIRPRGKMLLNPGLKSTAKLIKNKCRIRLAKRRSMIETRSLNLVINPGTGNKESNSNNPNGLSTNTKAVNYSVIPVKLHDPFKKSRKWIKFASQKKETKFSIPAKFDTLLNKDVLANQVTCLTRSVSYDAKVKPFILDEVNVLINNGTLGRSSYLFKK